MKTFYVCNNVSRANAVFNVVLFVEIISFYLFRLPIYACLFVCQTGSALHWASSDGHIEVVRLLLNRGADIQAQDKVSERVS